MLKDGLTPEVRAYIYNVLLTCGPLLVVYGVVSAAVWPLWLALGGALLGIGLARVNTPSKGKRAE